MKDLVMKYQVELEMIRVAQTLVRCFGVPTSWRPVIVRLDRLGDLSLN